MQSFLFSGNPTTTKSEIDKLAKEFSIINLFERPIKTVKEARELISETKISYENTTGYILTDFDQASEEAQESLLKTLEEPPSMNLFFILTVANIASLPQTILSRVQIKESQNEKSEHNFDYEKSYLESNLSQRLLKISKIKDRDEALIFMTNYIKLLIEKREFSDLSLAYKYFKYLKYSGNVSATLTGFTISLGQATMNT